MGVLWVYDFDGDQQAATPTTTGAVMLTSTTIQWLIEFPGIISLPSAVSSTSPTMVHSHLEPAMVASHQITPMTGSTRFGP